MSKNSLAKQRKAAAVLSGVAQEELVKKAAEASGVSEDTLCGWLADGGFREQFRNLADIKLYFELKDGDMKKGGRGGVKIVDDI